MKSYYTQLQEMFPRNWETAVDYFADELIKPENSSQTKKKSFDNAVKFMEVA